MIEECPDPFPPLWGLPEGFTPSGVCCAGYGMVVIGGTLERGGMVFPNWLVVCSKGHMAQSAFSKDLSFDEY